MKINLYNYKFGIGFLLFTVFNLVQAYFLEIHYDESYYWVYSHFPDWGYFDHPPMVAWILSAGRHLFPGTFGVRFVFICMSSAGLILIWKMVREYKDDPVLFWAIVFSITLFIPYTFFAIPDVPLFFFAVVYFYVYKLFLKKESALHSVLLGISAALMLYSKYHAVLVFLFTFLSNLQLIKSKFAWMAVGIALLFTMPHWYWQYSNNFPSIQYQLIDNHKKAYSIMTTLEYLGGQLVATGILSGWLFLYSAARSPVNDKWERALKFSFAGIFIFFFLVTFSGDIENHWTFVACIPMLILAYKFIIKHEKWNRLTIKLGIWSFTIFFIARAFVVIAGNGIYINLLKGHLYKKEQYSTLGQAVGDYPLVTQTTYGKAALYAYFNDKAKETYAMSSGFYHRTQFDFYPTEEYLQGKTVYYAGLDSLQLPGEYQSVQTIKNHWFIKKVENFRSYNLLKLGIEKESIALKNRQLNIPEIELTNPYKRELELNANPELAAHFQCYVLSNKKWKLVDSVDLDNILLKPDESISIKNISFNIPDWVKTGEHLFYIGMNNGFFNPIQSNIKKRMVVD